MIERISPSPISACEPLEPRAMLAGDLAVTGITASVIFSSQLQQRLVASTVTVQNIGDETVRGTPVVDFFLSADETVGNTDFLLTTKAIPTIMAVGRSIKVSMKELIPHDLLGLLQPGVTLPSGEYRLIGRLRISGGAADEFASNNSAVADGTVPVTYEFGEVDRHKTLMLRMFVTPTQFATIRLWGGGQGEIVADGTSLSLRLTGTTTRSKLNIETPNRFISSSFAGITVEGPIGHISAPFTDINGDINIEGALGTLNIRSINGSAWTIGGSDRQARITIGSAVNVSLSSAQPISRLTSGSWLTFDGGDDALIAPRIGTLSINGAFDPDLSISGTASRTSLAKVSISGAATGRWDILGDVNSVKIGSTGSTFAANISGALKSFTVAGPMSGLLAASSINRFFVGGDLSNAAILAGADLGSDGGIGGTGASSDLFSPGSIRSIRVLGTMSNTLIAAGLDPVNNSLLDGDDRFVDDLSRLGTIVVGGNATGSSFASPNLPGRANVNGGSVKTSADSRFVSTLA